MQEKRRRSWRRAEPAGLGLGVTTDMLYNDPQVVLNPQPVPDIEEQNNAQVEDKWDGFAEENRQKGKGYFVPRP